MLDFRDVECLIALADEQNFSRAAARLGLAQPALSKRIQKIETQLGVSLFVRNSQGATPTDAGNDLVTHARDIRANWRSLEGAAAHFREGTRGFVRIGAVGSAFYEALPTLLARASSELPEVRLQIREMETPQAMEALRFGDIDLAFVRPPGEHGLETRTVWIEELVLAAPSDTLIAALTRLSVEDLRGERIIFFRREAGAGYWDRVSRLFMDANVPFAPEETADHMSTILGLVALGLGVSVVPASARRFALPNVVYVPLTESAPLPLAVASNPGALARTARLVLATLPSQPVRASLGEGV